MIVGDWSDVAAPAMDEAYRRERDRWMHGLGWDPDPSHRLLEQARLERRAHGFVVRDAGGRVAGWTYFSEVERILQIGGLVGDSPAAVRLLLDRIVSSDPARAANRIHAFVYGGPEVAALTDLLSASGFVVGHHAYLARDLDTGGGREWRTAPTAPPLTIRRWRAGDVARAACLLQSAYAGRPETLCFAPHGRIDEWTRYVFGLSSLPGCGRLLSEASLVAERDEHGHLGGLAIVTGIADGVAHLAQLAVSPSDRRRGLALELVGRAGQAAAGCGFRRLTLVVCDENAEARALYAGLGFRSSLGFLRATRS